MQKKEHLEQLLTHFHYRSTEALKWTSALAELEKAESVPPAAKTAISTVTGPLEPLPPASWMNVKLPSRRRVWLKEEDEVLLCHVDIVWRHGMLNKDLESLLGQLIPECSIESIKKKLQTLSWIPPRATEDCRRLPRANPTVSPEGSTTHPSRSELSAQASFGLMDSVVDKNDMK